MAVFFRIAALESSAKFTGKHLSWSQFFKLQASKFIEKVIP